MTLPLVSLHVISPREAGRIVNRTPDDADRWHPQYPFDDELAPLRSHLAATSPDPVFTFYQVREVATGLAIGGIGFFGPPSASGTVELGFGLVEAARGRGLATDALRQAVEIAQRAGAKAVIADTLLANEPSQRVLAKNGFVEYRRDATLVYFRRDLLPTPVLEHALLPVIRGRETEFEAAFAEARGIIAAMPGFRSLTLSRSIESPGSYLLLVGWDSLEHHTVGFRTSPDYQRWRALLHHFYEPFPTVEHFVEVPTPPLVLRGPRHG